jgi:hypothetical protein
MLTRRILRTISLALLVYIVAQASAPAQDPTIYVIPREVSEEAKVLALKLGYALNDNSMVRWGSIDLTNLPPELKRKVEPPPAPLVDEITPEKKKRRGR